MRGPAHPRAGRVPENTVCFAHGAWARLAPDTPGNLDEPAAVEAFHAAVERLPDAPPRWIAHDLHPDFHSTRHAIELAERLGVEAVAVQHHHAHTAAVMAEHGIDKAVLGLSLDGFGLGPNNESWGGELLRVDASGCRRLGHLAPSPSRARTLRRASPGAWERRHCTPSAAATRSPPVTPTSRAPRWYPG